MQPSTQEKNQQESVVEAVRQLVSGDMNAVNQLIKRSLHSDVELIGQLGHYIIGSGGKRLRPTLALLCARACGYQGDLHIHIAAIVEFIHTATLLHDDVVDASELRRGHETANAIWGNEASVLVGDFVYSRAFEMMVEVNNMRVMEVLAHATNTIAEGEVMQLLNCHNADTTTERYLNVIHCKTAKLFEAGAQLGAILANCTSEQEQAMSAYGMHLGTAFQLIDDVLDYSASAEDIGKNIGDDLAEGKPTLPLIYAMANGTPEQAAIVREAIEEGGRDRIHEVKRAIESTGAIDYTARLAREEALKAQRALAAFPASSYIDALMALADFSADRSY
jgi:octaprenyl-diphosphate synthase